jgi:hypothetical protein
MKYDKESYSLERVVRSNSDEHSLYDDREQ